MKLQLPSWFTSPKKTAAPSAAAVALDVAAAEQTLEAAQARVDEARAALASDRSDAALLAVRQAKDAAGDVEEMLAVLRADHAAALEREGAAERAVLEQRRDELAEILTVASILERAADLAEQEAGKLLELAHVRNERLAQVDELRRLKNEQISLLLQLGDIATVSEAPGINVEIAASPDVVCNHLDALSRHLSPAQERIRILLGALRPTHKDYPGAFPQF